MDAGSSHCKAEPNHNRIEKKILSMYAKGMTTSDIEGHIRDIYGVDVSDTTVSRITDKILPTAKE